MAEVRQAYAVLTGEIWPHENAEEADLYPAVNRLPGGNDPTAAMSRAHAEISYQIARLGRLIAEIGDRAPDEADIANLRTTLHGLYAILRLHTAQEDEAYLSLGDEEARRTAGDERPCSSYGRHVLFLESARERGKPRQDLAAQPGRTQGRRGRGG